MKFTIERDVLLDGIQRLQSVVEKKSTVAILSNILCEVSDSKVGLYATDLEVGMKVTLPIQTEQEGRITLSAKNFLDIVKELPSGPVHLSKRDNDWIQILSGKSKFNIVSLPADEYPKLPGFEDKEYFKARVKALSEMIDRTAFAVSTDATRYHLNGVFFEPLENGVMRMTATDGHRLSCLETEVFLDAPQMKRGIIIPRKGLSEVRRLLEQNSESIELAFDRGYLFARDQSSALFVRLIDGEYPDVRQVIPSSTKYEAILDRGTFMSALRRVSLLAHEKSRGVKLNFQNNLLLITSSNPDKGDAREELDIEFEGEATEVGFNARYFLDCLTVLDSERVCFQFNDRLNPGVLRGYDQKNYTYVIMPMRI